MFAFNKRQWRINHWLYNIVGYNRQVIQIPAFLYYIKHSKEIECHHREEEEDIRRNRRKTVNAMKTNYYRQIALKPHKRVAQTGISLIQKALIRSAGDYLPGSGEWENEVSLR